MTSPPRRPDLQLSITEFHELQRTVNESRKSATTVKVKREALWKLLSDHSNVCAYAGIQE